ncbi:MAG: endolytic transglycosylase MltG [Janthinobacterium lividum]
MKSFFRFFLLLVVAGAAGLVWWANSPIIARTAAPVAFSIAPGSGVHGATQDIARAGVPLQPWLLELLARLTGRAPRLKAGSYELKPGTSPHRLLNQLARGEFAQESIAIIEGWTFRQMRQAIALNRGLKQDTLDLTDAELLARITPDFKYPEGLFFPDTYLFAKGASDLQIYRQAFALLQKRLEKGWKNRSPALPYKTPYEALIMASIVEKETGQAGERAMIAGVFVNRLRQGMMLQTDPTVIYGMGEHFQGNIRKTDLLTDTPYNTYRRTGLPPTPIALAGVAALTAALNPAPTDALYFVARGDGSSHFSSSLEQHNQAVNRYQRNR